MLFVKTEELAFYRVTKASNDEAVELEAITDEKKLIVGVDL